MRFKFSFLLLFLIFTVGFSGLSLELIVLRQLSNFVGSGTIPTSIVIGVVLAFMSVGYYRGSVLKTADVSLRQMISRDFFLIAVMVLLSGSYLFVTIYFELMKSAGITSHIAQTFIYSLLFLSLSSYLFGKITSVVSRYLHHSDKNYTGRVMAVDTVGSVLGSLLTTLVLMPFIGVNHTLMLVVLLTLAASTVFFKPNFIPRAGYFSALAVVFAFTVAANSDKMLFDTLDVVENNAVSTISLIKGDEGKSLILSVNGSASSKISEDKDLMFAYVRYIEDNFIANLPKSEKKKVLVLGAGGFTMGLNDTFHDYTYIDVDKSLLEVSERDFLKKKLEPNKKFIVQDANQFLKEPPEKYDLIILDTYSSRYQIPITLITEEYFTRVRNSLNKGGIAVMNIIAHPAFRDDFSKNIDNTLRKVFPKNLSRHVIGSFSPYQENPQNIAYVFYNVPETNEIYTVNRNRSFYD